MLRIIVLVAIVLANILTVVGCALPLSDTDSRPTTAELSDAAEFFSINSKRISGTGCYVFAGLVFCVVEQTVSRNKLPAAKIKAPHLALALLRKSYPKLPASFILESNLVENTYDDASSLHRYVIAYRLNDVETAMTEAHTP